MNVVSRAYSLKPVDVWAMDLPDFWLAFFDAQKNRPIHKLFRDAFFPKSPGKDD